MFAGRNDTAISAETIEVAANGAGSRVTYTNELRFTDALNRLDR